MTYFRAAALLVLVVLITFGSGRPTLAVEVSRHPDRCRILASTGKSEAGRDPESRETCARVDDRLTKAPGASSTRSRAPVDNLVSPETSSGFSRPHLTATLCWPPS
jgi:hypothetical protein